jgi:hypothetical protein
MMTRRHGIFSHAFLLLVLSFGLGLAGCEGDDGAPGQDGIDGQDGATGAAGQACWDLNNNGIGDPEEDINGDGVVDVFDCNAYASGAYEIDQLHVGYFTEHTYEGTDSCLNCHGKLADEFLTTAHFTWEGVASNIEGFEGGLHGKKDILNNFCIGIGGMPYHSVDEGVMRQCDDCHGSAANIHAGTSAELIVSNHTTLACQVCHIPAIARDTSTKVDWDWSTAGEVVDPIPIDPETNRATYSRQKGTFIWANDVRPELRYFNGKWRKMLVGVNDTYDSEPAVMAEPVGDFTDPEAMIYPFKKMVGTQPADVVNQRILVPHLFGTAGGPNPFWGKWDWDLALLDAAALTGQPYTSGDFGFVSTEMYLSVNHEVAPKEMAFGMDGDCADCHLDGQIEWQALGWSDDPVLGGTRPD